MPSELRALAYLILDEIDCIEVLYSRHNKSFPSLDDPSKEPFIEDPKFTQSATNVVAAAARLIASLRNPHAALHELSGSMYTSAFLNVAVEANVTEALREAGSQGMHIRDLAVRCGVDPVKLGQGLRYLCAMHHIYREVSPDIFTNNRISIALDTGRAFNDLKLRGPSFETGGSSSAIVAFTTSLGLKGSTMISELLLNPKTSFNKSLADAPVVRSIHFDGPLWDYFELPGNEKIMKSFGVALATAGLMFPQSLILTAFNWASLPKGAKVVDIGGGFGGSTMPLAKVFRDLRFIIQDRPAVVPVGEKFWRTANSEALVFGIVEYQAHNFFEPQPVTDASVFILRFILHDWSSTECNRILSHLRDAATPATRLVILELIVPYTCPDDGKHEHIPGVATSIQNTLPEVLCGNVSIAKGVTYMTDAQMLNMFNSQERTLGQWVELLNSAGWEIEAVRDGALSSIICAPILPP